MPFDYKSLTRKYMRVTGTNLSDTKIFIGFDQDEQSSILEATRPHMSEMPVVASMAIESN